jgi:ubiquinone/menaquinone biosynthesis C-methylase UbiE
MLKSLALRIPRVKALVSQRDALFLERDALLSEREQLLGTQGICQEKRIAGLSVENAQLSDALKHANALPLPPRHLQERVVGGYFADFLKSATRTLSEFDGILKSVGKTLDDFERVLDLGVGCGRVIRRFHELYPRTVMTGGDIDTEAIAWLQQNYAPIGRFLALPHLPPTDLKTGEFEFGYAVSVFTHLDEQMQFAWLAELQRVIDSGGYLVLTVHGKNHYDILLEGIKRQSITGGFYYDYDSIITDGLPEFYKVTYHTREYVYREWSRFFEVVDYVEQGAEGHQDLILCRRR